MMIATNTYSCRSTIALSWVRTKTTTVQWEHQQTRLIRSRTMPIASRYMSSSSSSSTTVVDETPTPTIETRTTPGTNNQHELNYAPIFVAATKQHVGKTSVSLALLSGLVKRFGNNRVGFMKPVGQKHLDIVDEANPHIIKRIDKDAVLIRQHFGFDHIPWECTSPVLIPQGYTKDYLDGAVSSAEQIDKIQKAFNVIQTQSDIILCEGTGHCAVGNIIDASNADVASLLGAHMVLVANGGLGNAYDELSLNRNWCVERNVPIAGVIINQIRADKFDQTVSYLKKAIEDRWDIPLLGTIPDRPFLGCAALTDLERLLTKTRIITGQQHKLRHYRIQDIQIVANSLEVFLKQLRTNTSRTLYVCHSSRTDILLGYLMESVQRMTNRAADLKSKHGDGYASDDENAASVFESAIVVTGCDEYPISTQILEIITSSPNKQYAPPVVLTGETTDSCLLKLYNYTPKLNIQDTYRVATAIEHYEKYIDFDLLLDRVSIKHKVSNQL
jgi:BioD-like phosphotransacetylase family protein